jgi:hypothetical protein
VTNTTDNVGVCKLEPTTDNVSSGITDNVGDYEMQAITDNVGGSITDNVSVSLTVSGAAAPIT